LIYSNDFTVCVQGKGSHAESSFPQTPWRRTVTRRKTNHSAKYKDATLAFKPNCQRTNRLARRPVGLKTNPPPKPAAAQWTARHDGQGARRAVCFAPPRNHPGRFSRSPPRTSAPRASLRESHSSPS